MKRTIRNYGQAVWSRAQPQLLVLVSLTIIVGGTWGFVELAGEVFEGDTKAFDEWALLAMRNPEDVADPLGPRWLEELGRDLTALGGMTILTLVIVIVCGALLLSKTYRTAVFVAVATSTGMSTSLLLKRFFERPRPDLVDHLSHVMTSSFPSGHAMMSAIVYLTLGGLLASVVKSRWLQAYLLIVAFSITGLVGVSRVYVGVHYPTDVMAGWTLGLVWASGALLLFRYLQRSGDVEQQVQSGPVAPKPESNDTP